MTVNFWNFSKKANSTARPTGNPASVFDVRLKDTSGILNPVLEIFNSVGWNPSALCYAQIPSFGRYYNVQDWQWIGGRWECTLAVDPLASWKADIGNLNKYILRSAHASNINIVDTFYPSLAWEPNYYYYTADFNFNRSFEQGTYILGVGNQDPDTFGAVSYYAVSAAALRTLVSYMYPISTNQWDVSTTQVLWEWVVRNVYQPMDFLKSCTWFPFLYYPSGAVGSVPIYFGNFESTAYGIPVDPTVNDWYINSRTVYLPTGWLSLEAKYRVNPYAHLYLVINPWGIIELNPMDFTDSREIKLYIYPDLLSGDALLKIFKVVGTSEYFITQRNAKLSVDINMSASASNVMGMLTGVASVAGGAVTIATAGTGAAVATGAITTLSGASQAVISSVPSLSSSAGQTVGGARAMDGVATLIYTSTYFATENNSEFGKPLFDTRTLNTLPGYIKCGDGDHNIPCFVEEASMISDFLKGGFYYE